MAARYGLARIGVENGQIYSGFDLTIGLLVVCYAVLACEIRRKSVAQALIAAGGYGLLLTGALLLVGAELSLGLVSTPLLLLGLALAIGGLAEAS